MKNVAVRLAAVSLAALAFSGCAVYQNQRIAQLEARVARLEAAQAAQNAPPQNAAPPLTSPRAP